MKVRADKIGSIVTTRLGTLKVKAEHAAMFARQGRYDLLEDVKESEELVPLADLTLKQLRPRAIGLKGYKYKMSRKQLIELINATP